MRKASVAMAMLGLAGFGSAAPYTPPVTGIFAGRGNGKVRLAGPWYRCTCGVLCQSAKGCRKRQSGDHQHHEGRHRRHPAAERAVRQARR